MVGDLPADPLEYTRAWFEMIFFPDSTPSVRSRLGVCSETDKRAGNSVGYGRKRDAEPVKESGRAPRRAGAC